MITHSLLENTNTQKNRNLLSISQEKTILLVFLRHFGCVFCREAMKDLSKKREEYQKRNVELIFVHMSDVATADEYFVKYNLTGVDSIADPECALYANFGPLKGKPNQLLGLKNWVRGVKVFAKDPSILSARQIGDGFQMPGVFMIQNGGVMESFVHKSAAARPDYDSLVDCCTTPAY